VIFKSINLVNQDPSAVSTSKGEKGIGIRVKGDSEVMHLYINLQYNNLLFSSNIVKQIFFMIISRMLCTCILMQHWILNGRKKIKNVCLFFKLVLIVIYKTIFSDI